MQADNKGVYMSWYGGYAPYVPVAERRRRAIKKMSALKKKGKDVSPIQVEGRTIAQTFWGKAWCDHLEAYSDFDNRLSRGRTYVRNGSVVHLEVKKGQIEAFVAGSRLYSVKIKIDAVRKTQWNEIKKQCSGQIDSLVELLGGEFSDSVMKIMTTKKTGLFPAPKQISLSCSCPDGATMCKHVAATLYGVGVKLDESPELLFELRKVDHMDLITEANTGRNIQSGTGKKDKLKGKDLSSLFGIEVVEKPSTKVSSARASTKPSSTRASTRVSSARVSAKKKMKKKTSVKKKLGKKSLSKKKLSKKKLSKKKTSLKKKKSEDGY